MRSYTAKQEGGWELLIRGQPACPGCSPGRDYTMLAEAFAALACPGNRAVSIQVPVQWLVGLQRAHLVAQPPQVPLSHPLQRLGLGRVPPWQSPPGERTRSPEPFRDPEFRVMVAAKPIALPQVPLIPPLQHLGPGRVPPRQSSLSKRGRSPVPFRNSGSAGNHGHPLCLCFCKEHSY